MSRLLSIFILIFLASCASQPPVSSLQIVTREEKERLHDIYRSAFERGFLEAWAGDHIVIETAALVGKSTDPEGEWALHEGHMDGQRAGFEARLAYEKEQAEKEKH